MSLHKNSALLRATAGWLMLGATVCLTACAGSTPARTKMVRYDLGVADTASRPDVNAVRPTLKVVAVTAPSVLDNNQFHYRLVYSDPLASHSYGRSQWAATPPQLLTERLRGRLAGQWQILDGADPERAPVLKVALLDFSQRFDAPGEGRGVVAVRASLSLDGRLIAQRDFSTVVASASADAAGGATSIAAAAMQVVQDIDAWLLPQRATIDATPLARRSR